VLLVVVFLVSCGAPSSSPTPAAPSPPASTSASASPTPTVGATARIVATKKLTSRSADLTIESPAVGDHVQVRLLLPAHFETQPKRRWPVLYLLHGCCDTYLSWTRDVFQGYLGLVSSQGTPDPLALWGDPESDAPTWKQHNPYDLAPQLTRIPLFISAGNGDPGPLDERGTAPDSIEPAINAENKEFAQHLRKVSASVTVDLYGDGTHNWVYWHRELHRAWPILTNKLEST
jgi:hypothetical protein